MNNPKYILFHTTDTPYATSKSQFNSVNNYHRDTRGFPKSSLGLFVGYHRLITGGQNIQCRLDTDSGSHCNNVVDGLSMNLQSLGVAIGFDGDVEFPTQADALMLQAQIWAWQDKYNIPNKNVLFHRDFTVGKTCPGKPIKRAWLEQLIRRTPKEPLVDVAQAFWLIALLRKLGIIK